MTKELAQAGNQPPGAPQRWKIALRHPAAKLPLVAAGALGLSYLLFAHSILVLAAAGIVLLAGAGAGFFLSQSGSRWVSGQLEAAHERQALEARAGELNRLKRALARLKWEDGVSGGAERAIGQLDQLADRFEVFEKALRAKMTPGELTYERYYSTAYSVRQAVLQNLQSVLLSLQSLQAIGAQDSTLKAAETSKLEALLKGNDTALTRLMEAAQAVSDIKTSRDSASVNLDATLQELKELAARASKYSS